MTCIKEELFHVVDFENDKGLTGYVGLSKELFDEEDASDLTEMLVRLIDAWMKRREFIHRNIEHYKKLC